MANVTKKGTISKVKDPGSSFTFVPESPPPASIPFVGVSDKAFAIAVAAWGSGKSVEVTFPEEGGALVSIEGV